MRNFGTLNMKKTTPELLERKMGMKGKTDVLLVMLMTASALACVVLWHVEIVWVFVLSVVPFFCVQMLLCRLTRRWWLRLQPLLPVAVLAGTALFYLVRDSGWDRLGALIFGLAAIAPTVGIGLGWGVWGICLWSKKRKMQEER